jgi:hypothetical protein
MVRSKNMTEDFAINPDKEFATPATVPEPGDQQTGTGSVAGISGIAKEYKQSKVRQTAFTCPHKTSGGTPA